MGGRIWFRNASLNGGRGRRHMGDTIWPGKVSAPGLSEDDPWVIHAGGERGGGDTRVIQLEAGFFIDEWGRVAGTLMQ